MAELFDLVEGKAAAQAQALGFSVVRAISTTILRIDVIGAPRYTVTNEIVNADMLYNQVFENCGLRQITRSVNFDERRQYGFSIDLDARMRGAGTGMASVVEYLAVPTISSTTATQQLTLHLELTLGSAIHGSKTFERRYSENTVYELPPCSYTRVAYSVRNRTLSGTLEVDLHVFAMVTLDLRLVTAGQTVTFALPQPVDVPTTATGRFSGIVADDLQMHIQQIACRKGLCGALSNEQLGELWGLHGAPAGAIPIEFEEAGSPADEDVPEGEGKCFIHGHCSGPSYASSYLECVADPIACSWQGPDGACHEIRSED